MRVTQKDATLDSVLARARACRLCDEHLAHGCRPVLQAGAGARLLIIGQAPGRAVHACGQPWMDASGRTLRAWLGMNEADFYDAERVAILPMGFGYPGKGKSGDLPPRPECAPLWHAPLLGFLPRVELTLLIGLYAQRGYLTAAPATLTENVRSFRAHLPRFFPLPHPSPRNRPWLAANPWFEREAIPELRRRVAAISVAHPPVAGRPDTRHSAPLDHASHASTVRAQ